MNAVLHWDLYKVKGCNKQSVNFEKNTFVIGVKVKIPDFTIEFTCLLT
jgi:hypothetical protein